MPITRSAWQGGETLIGGPEALDVRWLYAGGTIRFAANIDAPLSVVTPAPGERIVWSSPGLEVSDGSPVPLTPWTGLVLIGPAS